MVISTANAEHYLWGEGCDGWHLVKTEMLSVISERVPPECKEIRHYHQKSEQFFFVLTGTASLEVEGRMILLKPQEGFHVKAGKAHQLRNDQDNDLIFLVTSVPPSHEDRVQAENIKDQD